MLRVTEAEYEPGLRQGRHAHEHHTVSLVLAGGLRERVGRVEETAGVLNVVVKPAGTEHRNDFGPDPTRLLRITFASDLSRDFARFARHLSSWRWQTASASAPAFLRLLRSVRSLPPDDPSIAEAALDVLAALSLESAPFPAGSPPRWLEEVRERVCDTNEPSVSALARDAGVHPVYLARQFRRWYGCSIRDHRRGQRAQRAAAALTTIAGTISSASHVAGFSDHAHMCRTLKDATGLTPKAIRSLLAKPV